MYVNIPYMEHMGDDLTLFERNSGLMVSSGNHPTGLMPVDQRMVRSDLRVDWFVAIEIKENDEYPLVDVYRTMERSKLFNGKLFISMANFNSYPKLPEGNYQFEGSPFSHKPM